MLEQIGRLAMRVEGKNWTAYFARTDTMENVLYLGSIRLTLVESRERKEQFLALMREVFADMVEQRCGVRPTWNGPQPAPEHERSGRA